MAKRFGPQMRIAQEITKHNPGIIQVHLAKRVGPNGSNYYGTRIVHRALVNGLLRTGSCVEAQCQRPAVNHIHYWAVAS